jgi:hypothetical protein
MHGTSMERGPARVQSYCRIRPKNRLPGPLAYPASTAATCRARTANPGEYCNASA